MTLGGFILRRLLALVPTVLGVTILVFFLIHLIPGDPARTILGNQATPARIALVRHDLGLDQSLPVQYEKFMARLAHGNLGTSLFYNVGAGRLVLQRLPVTLWLLGFGTLLSLLLAVPLAALAATRRDTIADHVVRAVPLVGLGFPAFWVGTMLTLLFALNLGRAFPVGGYGSGFFGHVHSMFLPALTVALGIAPILIRSLRASLLEVFESEYVTTARSKGISERRVLVRHALRNAIVSTVSVLGVNVAYLIGGTLIVEQVFAVGGAGQLMIDSINARDFPVVQAVTFVFAIMVVLTYLITDVVHALLDPRVRFD
ncbi:MAG TPA: ABC transporter permease [Gaiellaceae bacterium]|nr:ABC transporter permease [Gaiellaceae bacterium]